MSIVQTKRRTRKTQGKPSTPPAVSAGQVREMLLSITYALHATRVVGRVGPIAPRKG